jgi:hypothetical protein
MNLSAPAALPSRPEAPAHAAQATWRAPLLFGAVTSLLQLGLCLALAGKTDLAEAHDVMLRWDSGWYLSIVEFGYRTALPPEQQQLTSNVGFFPGYPILARLLHLGLGLTPGRAMLLVAQGAAVAFWVFFYRLVQRAHRSNATLGFAGLLVLCFPTAFFLQAGYSESLFLASLLGFFVFQAEPRPRPVAAAAAGFLMTATRIVGMPVAMLGLLQALLHHLPGRPPLRVLVRQGLLAAASLAGAGAFFLYCHLRWGHWNLYMWTQEVGWLLTPDYRAILQPSSWTHFTFPEGLDPARLVPLEASQLATSLSLWGFVATAALEGVLRWGFGVRGLRERLPYYLAALTMEFVAVSGLAGLKFTSMMRYVFPVHVLLVLAQVHLWARMPERLKGPRRAALAALALLAVYLGAVHLHLLKLYIAWQWVA